MNAFDFDKTIYEHDSTTEFYKYCLKKYPKLIFMAPYHLALFAFCNVTKAKQHFYRFLRHLPDVDKLVSDFWDEQITGIKPWYKSVQREDDVIISASSRFLITPICERLGIKYIIASEIDKKTGLCTGVNCGGKEKVRKFREMFKDETPEYFFSDSFRDDPMAKISRYAFAVRKNELFPWEEYFNK